MSWWQAILWVAWVILSTVLAAMLAGVLTVWWWGRDHRP